MVLQQLSRAPSLFRRQSVSPLTAWEVRVPSCMVPSVRFYLSFEGARISSPRR